MACTIACSAITSQSGIHFTTTLRFPHHVVIIMVQDHRGAKYYRLEILCVNNNQLSMQCQCLF